MTSLLGITSPRARALVEIPASAQDPLQLCPCPLSELSQTSGKGHLSWSPVRAGGAGEGLRGAVSFPPSLGEEASGKGSVCPQHWGGCRGACSRRSSAPRQPVARSPRQDLSVSRTHETRRFPVPPISVLNSGIPVQDQG